MGKKVNLGLASASLLLGLAGSAIDNPIYAQEKTQDKIYSASKELTATGDGVFGKYIIVTYEPTQENPISLRDSLSSMSGQQIRYSVPEAKSYLERVARNLSQKKNLTDKERAFNKYLKNLSASLKPNDPEAIRILNQAVSDGVISFDEISELRDIKDETYAIVGRTSSNDQYTGASLPILVRFKLPKSGLEARTEEKKEEIKEKPIQREYTTPITKPTTQRPSTAKKTQTYPAMLSVGAKYNTNEELIPEIRFDFPVNNSLAFTLSGGYAALKGKGYMPDSTTETTIREKQLIGPGTYKLRTDEITSTTLDELIGEAFGGISLTTQDRAEVYFGAGVALFDSQEKECGQSTISFERNQEIIETNVIGNTRENPKTKKTKTLFRGGFQGAITDNVIVGASYTRINGKNIFGVNANLRFNLGSRRK